jgi:hypothetical protein
MNQGDKATEAEESISAPKEVCNRTLPPRFRLSTRFLRATGCEGVCDDPAPG